MNIIRSPKGQAMPDGIISFGKEAFAMSDRTEIRWLGGAGIFICSHGTALMIDPVLEGFDMPLLLDAPIACGDVPRLDSVLVTHIDSDHYSTVTCKKLKNVCGSYHSTEYVADEMKKEDLPAFGHNIGNAFMINDIKITPTPVHHTWQNEYEEYSCRKWEEKDYCGYGIETPDGIIWLPGDSRLMDEHLHMPFSPDVILFDFSDDSWHIGFDNAVRLANAYPDAKLICIHWGTVDAPDLAPFNPDPTRLFDKITSPERINVLRPGEPFIL